MNGGHKIVNGGHKIVTGGHNCERSRHATMFLAALKHERPLEFRIVWNFFTISELTTYADLAKDGEK